MRSQSFTNVTEQPGQKATAEQMTMMMTRYHLAAQYSQGKNILEVACGSGTGLDYLSRNAKSVVGGDIDKELVAIAKKNYPDNAKIKIIQFDALNIPFSDNSFDLVVFFEAIYYLSDVNQFLKEVKRVLKIGGKIIISTVNCEWHGFNPSPFSTKYWTVAELQNLLESHQLATSVLMGFLDEPRGHHLYISALRKLAVSLRLIPTTMEGKERLKRLFYGSLKNIPTKIYEGMSSCEPLETYTTTMNMANYKQIYIIAQK